MKIVLFLIVILYTCGKRAIVDKIKCKYPDREFKCASTEIVHAVIGIRLRPKDNVLIYTTETANGLGEMKQSDLFRCDVFCTIESALSWIRTITTEKLNTVVISPGIYQETFVLDIPVILKRSEFARNNYIFPTITGGGLVKSNCILYISSGNVAISGINFSGESFHGICIIDNQQHLTNRIENVTISTNKFNSIVNSVINVNSNVIKYISKWTIDNNIIDHSYSNDVAGVSFNGVFLDNFTFHSNTLQSVPDVTKSIGITIDYCENCNISSNIFSGLSVFDLIIGNFGGNLSIISNKFSFGISVTTEGIQVNTIELRNNSGVNFCVNGSSLKSLRGVYIIGNHIHLLSLNLAKSKYEVLPTVNYSVNIYKNNIDTFKFDFYDTVNDGIISNNYIINTFFSINISHQLGVKTDVSLTERLKPIIKVTKNEMININLVGRQCSPDRPRNLIDIIYNNIVNYQFNELACSENSPPQVSSTSKPLNQIANLYCNYWKGNIPSNSVGKLEIGVDISNNLLPSRGCLESKLTPKIDMHSNCTSFNNCNGRGSCSLSCTLMDCISICVCEFPFTGLTCNGTLTSIVDEIGGYIIIVVGFQVIIILILAAIICLFTPQYYSGNKYE